MTERTEAWVLFDDTNLYIACRCWDTNPERIVANDMRRDSSSISNQDGFTVALDTFNDQRDGFMFTVTPAGAMRDGTTAERANFNWNTVWDGKATRSDRGWVTEMAIPFKSLRYRPGREQTWSIQLRRAIVGKNEAAYLTPVSPAWSRRAIYRYTEAATLVGLEAPATRNLEIKPYAMSTVTTDLQSSPALRNDFDPDGGIDVKYGLTKSLTADFTYNTDFAQVEVDEAQVNLTRFSLVFPEKRDFFLEGQANFTFGTGGTGSVGGRDVPTIFFSRRIGLSGGQAIPVIAGGASAGRLAPGTWACSTSRPTTTRPPAGRRRTLPCCGSAAMSCDAARLEASSRVGRCQRLHPGRMTSLGWTPTSPSTRTCTSAATWPSRGPRGNVTTT